MKKSEQEKTLRRTLRRVSVSMSKAVSKLIGEFEQLSPKERSEFISVAISQRLTHEDLGEENEAALIAAQTFARIDAEEEDGVES